MLILRTVFIFTVVIFLISCNGGENNAMMEQNPSPMEEHIRLHERIDASGFEGEKVTLTDIFQKDPVLIKKDIRSADSVNLLIHFHGSEVIVAHAIQQNEGWAGVSVNLGHGSSAYAGPLTRAGTFDSLLVSAKNHLDKPIRKLYLSGFSAGYGAIRSILKTVNYDKIDGVLLLDGLHASYIPPKTPISKGGKINSEDLTAFQRLAEDAKSGSKEFIFTHSSIFPGTFVSTTECAEFLLEATGVRREPVLKEGPLGMQQVGESVAGEFKILAFAGNTAPDHVDHLHGLFHFIKLFENGE